MYYLTENNEIISDEEKEKMNVSNNFKKQSENVFDLIEVGDLIQCHNSYSACVKRKAKSYDRHRVFMNDFSTIFDKHILAIYKPNQRGNYIKVWEVKDNESK